MRSASGMDEVLLNERKEVEPPNWARAWKSFNDACRRDPSRQSWLLLVSESTNLHVRDDENAKLRLNNPSTSPIPIFHDGLDPCNHSSCDVTGHVAWRFGRALRYLSLQTMIKA